MPGTDMYAATEVSKILGTANESYKTLKTAMSRMDANILTDMNVLFDKQIDTIVKIDALDAKLEKVLELAVVKAPKTHKVNKVLFWGSMGVLVYVAYKSTEPKKKGTNRG